MADVTFQLDAREEAAVRGFLEVARAGGNVNETLRRMRRESRRTGQENQQQNRGWLGDLDRVIVKWGGVRLAMGAIRSAYRGIIDDAVQFERRLQQQGIQLDDLIKRLQVQAGLSDKQTEVEARRIGQVGVKFGIENFEQLFADQTELASVGFANAAGKTLEAVTKFRLATNAAAAAGKDVNVIRPIAGFLNTLGEELTAENFERVGRKAAALFGSTPFESSDIQAISPEAKALRSRGFSEEGLFAFFTALKETGLQPGRAAIGLRNIFSRLATASERGPAEAALKELGLAVADVDLVGETPLETLEAIKAGFDRAKPERRAALLVNLVGEEAASVFETLLEKPDRIRQLVALQADTSGFDRAIRAQTTGPGFERRQEAASEQLLDILERERALTNAAVVKSLRNVSRQRLGRFAGIVEPFIKGAEAQLALGIQPEQLVFPPDVGGDVLPAALNRVEGAGSVPFGAGSIEQFFRLFRQAGQAAGVISPDQQPPVINNNAQVIIHERKGVPNSDRVERPVFNPAGAN